MTTNQELFERIRLLMIQHGTKDDVDTLHDLRERFNQLAAARTTDSSKVDRMAKILFESEEKHLHDAFPGRFAKRTWERDGIDPRSAYFIMARAAIDELYAGDTRS